MNEMIEDSLWSAIRALEERAMLMRHAAEHAREVSSDGDELRRHAEATQRRADLVRQVVIHDDEKAKAGTAIG